MGFLGIGGDDQNKQFEDDQLQNDSMYQAMLGYLMNAQEKKKREQDSQGLMNMFKSKGGDSNGGAGSGGAQDFGSMGDASIGADGMGTGGGF